MNLVSPARPRLWQASVVCALVAMLYLGPVSASAQSVPPGLPGHFAFGVAAGQGDQCRAKAVSPGTTAISTWQAA